MTFQGLAANKASGKLLLLCAFLVISLMNGAGLDLDMVLHDRFHHGEFHANTMNYLSDAQMRQQGLAIHGLLNIFPGIITAAIWGQDSHFVPTFAFLILLDIAAAFTLVLIAKQLVPASYRQIPLLISVSAAASLLVNHKDLFLLLTLLQFIIIVQNKQKDSLVTLFILFGFCTAFALFYSSDRGIAGVVSLGIATLFQSWFDRRFLIPVGVFVCSVIILSSSFELFSVPVYIRNINYLIASSPEWRYPWNLMTLTQVCGAVILNLLAFVTLWRSQSFSTKELINLAIPIALTALGLFMLKIGTNRADPPHIMNALWIPLLITISFNKKKERLLGSWSFLIVIALVILVFYTALFTFNLISFKHSVIMISVPLLIFLIFFQIDQCKFFGIPLINMLITLQLISFFYYTSVNIYNSNYSWISRVMTPPANVKATDKEVVWVANQIISNDAKCIFDMTNNGLINGLAKLPACSRFTYPIYAAPSYEEEIIKDLIETSPPIIIYSSNYWSYKIDGISMKDRYPILDEFLVNKFPFENCENDYCLRSLQ